MLAISLRHHCLVVTAIAFIGLLSTASADANPVSYDVQLSSDEAVTLSLLDGRMPSSAFKLVGIDVVVHQNAGEPYIAELPVLPVVSTGGILQEGDPISFTEDRGNSLSQANTAFDLNSAQAPIASDPDDVTINGVRLLLRELLPAFVLLGPSLASFGRAVPSPGALILLGLGLLSSAVLIRRITARKDSDSNSDAEKPMVNVHTEPEAEYREAEVADPAAPLFHQSASGQTDSIALSQPS